MLILLVGLRYRVGGDTLAYIDFFEDYPTVIELFSFDFKNAPYNPLWYCLNAIIKTIWNDFIFFQLVHAVIVNVTFFWFFKKYATHFFTTILIYYISYYLYFNMEVLREVLAICVFLISFPFLVKKKYFKYSFCLVVALLFHPSASIMFIVPLFFYMPKISWKFTLVSFIILFVILSVMDFVPLFSSFLTESVQLTEKIDTYTSLEGYTFNVRGVIANFLPILLFMYVNRKNDLKCFENKAQNLLFLYAIFICFTIFYAVLFKRMQNYLLPIYTVYMSNLVMQGTFKIDNRINKQGLISRFALFLFLFFSFKSYFVDTSKYMLGTKAYNIYYPYHSVLDPIKEVEREKFIDYYKAGE